MEHLVAQERFADTIWQTTWSINTAGSERQNDLTLYSCEF